jgi:hypothetical protein
VPRWAPWLVRARFQASRLYYLLDNALLLARVRLVACSARTERALARSANAAWTVDLLAGLALSAAGCVPMSALDTLRALADLNTSLPAMLAPGAWPLPKESIAMWGVLSAMLSVIKLTDMAQPATRPPIIGADAKAK